MGPRGVAPGSAEPRANRRSADGRHPGTNDTDRVLDGFEQMAGINTLFVATFTYGRGIAGRQLRGQPLPDHGRQEYDDGFRGGNFATPHPQFYRCTAIAPEKAPDHAAYDVLADVLPAARRRRMRLYC